jgi:hypothetical protein
VAHVDASTLRAQRLEVRAHSVEPRRAHDFLHVRVTASNEQEASLLHASSVLWRNSHSGTHGEVTLPLCSHMLFVAHEAPSRWAHEVRQAFELELHMHRLLDAHEASSELSRHATAHDFNEASHMQSDCVLHDVASVARRSQRFWHLFKAVLYLHIVCLEHPTESAMFSHVSVHLPFCVSHMQDTSTLHWSRLAYLAVHDDTHVLPWIWHSGCWAHVSVPSWAQLSRHSDVVAFQPHLASWLHAGSVVWRSRQGVSHFLPHTDVRGSNVHALASIEHCAGVVCLMLHLMSHIFVSLRQSHTDCSRHFDCTSSTLSVPSCMPV